MTVDTWQQRLWDQAKQSHLFLNDIEDENAKLFIRACFHKISDLEDKVTELHYQVKELMKR